MAKQPAKKNQKPAPKPAPKASKKPTPKPVPKPVPKPSKKPVKPPVVTKSPDDIIREQLLERLRALSQHTSRDVNGISDSITNHGDACDIAFGTTESEISAKLSEIGCREAAQIRYAIQQLDRGRYGVCENCEQKIHKDRLEALPYCTLCVPCQQKVEKGDIDEDEVRQRWAKLDKAAAFTSEDDDGPSAAEMRALGE